MDNLIKNMGPLVESTPLGGLGHLSYYLPWSPEEMTSYSVIMLNKYELSGSNHELNEAVFFSRIAIEIAPNNDPEISIYFNNHANSLQARFKLLGNIADLRQAHAFRRTVIACSSNNDPHRADFLANLGELLVIVGSRTALDEAVQILQEVVDSTPLGSPARVRHLTKLGIALDNRFRSTESLEDLARAIVAHTEAVDLTPENDPKRLEYLDKLAGSIQFLYQRTGLPEDLDRAIEFHKIVKSSVAENDPRQPIYFDNLGTALLLRFDRTGELADLETAVQTIQNAVDICPSSHQDRVPYLNNLCVARKQLYRQTNSGDELDRAIEAQQEAVNTVREDHPLRSGLLNNLALALMARLATIDDLDAVIRAYLQSVDLPSGYTTHRITAARSAAELLLIAGPNTEDASRLLKIGVELLAVACPRTLARESQQHVLSQFSGLAAFAAACALESEPNNIFEALRLLELGRGVISSLQLDTRTDVTRLEKANEPLASQFKALRDQLDPGTQIDRSGIIHFIKTDNEAHRETRHIVAREFDEVIRNIRSLPDFERFLLGPSAEELNSLAEQGPIIVFNVVKRRSDAFIITSDSIDCLRLPNLTYATLEENAKWFTNRLNGLTILNYRSTNVRLRKILEWLWDVAVEPVLERLGIHKAPATGEAWPRIWWVGSGWLHVLPVHAAGYHADSSCRTALDRVISSYTPTIKALAYANQSAANIAKLASPKTLFVSMPRTPAANDLPHVVKEIETLDSCLPSTISRTVLETPTKEDVMVNFRYYDIVHFACHGKSMSNPSESHLLLRDSPFSVADIAASRMEHPQLAYLSACHTADNQDAHLFDEGIHIAAACQLSGFPHVIGTLWQVQDSKSVQVARDVYLAMIDGSHVLDAGLAAWGLHAAVRSLREESRRHDKSSDPLTWAPFIHLGA